MRSLARLVTGLLLPVCTAAPIQAQQAPHVVDSVLIARTVATAAEQRRQNADAVRNTLARAEVRQTAQQLGVDLVRVDATVDTLNDRDLSELAAAARHVSDRLVGGASTVTLSTTTIIIGLLVLILIIVAVK
jgi:allophanate hydrolase subunit 1